MDKTKWQCSFEKLRDYPDCFQDCPDPEQCQMADSWKQTRPLPELIQVSSPHYHHWDDGCFYHHSHKGGQIPHGHHGSKYGLKPESATFPVDIKHVQLIPFIKAMDKVLCENDHKGGWEECSIPYLEARLVEEVGEYFRLVAIEADYSDRYSKQKPVDKKELIDIANFCMMLWDRSL